LISINPGPLGSASRYLDRYRELWEQRLDRLGSHLKSSNEGNNDAPIKEVELDRVYEAPVDAVWSAWTDPTKLREWWDLIM